MSPIALIINLFLAMLLLAALFVGISLNRRLKALRDGQAGFASAVADLDRAAASAHAGLAELRAATDEALDLLGGRITKARELAERLDGQLSARPVPLQPAALAPAAPVQTREPGFSPRIRFVEPEPGHAEADREPLRLDPRPTQRSRAKVDDDLFDLPLSRNGR